MGGLPCGTSSKSSDRRKEELRSWDWQSCRLQEMKAETGKCLKSYRWDPATSPLPLSIGSIDSRVQGPAELGKHGRGQSFSLLVPWSGLHTHSASSALKETISDFSPQNPCKRVCWRKAVSLNSLGFLSINSSAGGMLERGHRQWSHPRKSIYSRLSSAKESFCSGKSTSPCSKLYGEG